MQGTTQHAEDGDLVRLIDGEATQAERSAVAEHVMACTVCRARMETLRDRSAGLGALLAAGAAAIEVPPLPQTVRRAAPARTPWLRIAAMIVLVLGAGLLAPPVRAWIVEQWQVVVEWVGGPDAAPQVEAPAVGPEAGAVVSFEPQGDVFAIDLAHSQPAGELVLRVHADPRASARVLGGGGEELLVLPSGLRIGNARASASSYQVTVPAGLDRVQVRVGGREVAVVRPGEIGAGGERRIELGR